LGAGALPRKEAVVLKLPPDWRGRWHVRPECGAGSEEWRDGALWFKQHVEESLGKSPAWRLKVVTQAEAPTNPSTQLVLLIRRANAPALGGDDDEAALAAEGYDVRSYSLPDETSTVGALASNARSLAHLCQVFSVLKFRLAQLIGVCAVDQPPVECYKRIVTCLEAAKTGSAAPRGTTAARQLVDAKASHTLVGPAGISLSYKAAVEGGGISTDAVDAELQRLDLDSASAADVLGAIHRVAIASTRPASACYGEAIYFGNLTRGPHARAMRLVLDEGYAHAIWATAARSFADVGKGPGVGHATHAMSKQGGVLTLSILPEQHEPEPPETMRELEQLGYPAEYQAAHAYANVLALAGFDLPPDGRELMSHAGHPGMVVLVRIARNDEPTRAALARIFARVAEIVRMP
jgi:hypothetical protein